MPYDVYTTFELSLLISLYVCEIDPDAHLILKNGCDKGQELKIKSLCLCGFVFEEADSNFDGLGLNHQKKDQMNSGGLPLPRPGSALSPRPPSMCGGRRGPRTRGVLAATSPPAGKR